MKALRERINARLSELAAQQKTFNMMPFTILCTLCSLVAEDAGTEGDAGEEFMATLRKIAENNDPQIQASLSILAHLDGTSRLSFRLFDREDPIMQNEPMLQRIIEAAKDLIRFIEIRSPALHV